MLYNRLCTIPKCNNINSYWYERSRTAQLHRMQMSGENATFALIQIYVLGKTAFIVPAYACAVVHMNRRVVGIFPRQIRSVSCCTLCNNRNAYSIVTREKHYGDSGPHQLYWITRQWRRDNGARCILKQSIGEIAIDNDVRFMMTAAAYLAWRVGGWARSPSAFFLLN